MQTHCVQRMLGTTSQMPALPEKYRKPRDCILKPPTKLYELRDCYSFVEAEARLSDTWLDCVRTDERESAETAVIVASQ